MKRMLSIVFPSLLLAGCAVGPNYKRPLVPVPEQWTVAPARGTSTQALETDEWWSSFRDPELNSLVERAADRNLDLKLALERVQEARAARGIARSGYFPSVDAGVSATRLRGGISQGVIRAVPSSADPDARPSLISPFETNSFQGNLSASWEIDVFGGIRRGVEAAAADAAAAEENRRDVLVILLGDVGRVYAQLRGFQRRLEIANKNIKTQQSPIPSVGPDVEVGLPSGLLQRRPDIRRAEAQLAAATARVGEAKADLFPRFLLTGTAGRQATQLSDLTLGLGNFFSFGPGISVPLFNGGRIRSNIAVQSSRQRAALIGYRSAILNALEEVQNALVNYSDEQERRDRLDQAVRQSQLAVDLAAEQYRAGLVDFLSVLEAQRALYANEDQLVQSQTSVTTNLVTLYRALGGGWSAGSVVSPNVRSSGFSLH